MIFSSSDNIEIFDRTLQYSSNGIDFDTISTSLYSTAIDTFIFETMGVTSNAQLRITVQDVAGNKSVTNSPLFSIIDNTSPMINLLSPVSETVVGIGDELEITWSDSDNVGVEVISLYYKTMDNWNIIAENIDNLNTFNWIIPNEPTENLEIRIIGQDEVGLRDTSEVYGIDIEISFPMVHSINPEIGMIDFKTNQFQFNLSQPLDPSSVTNENITTISMHSNNPQPTIEYIDSLKSIKISFEDNIVSMDSISITLTESLTNIYGYQLDGNGDGDGGDPFEVTYRTSMLADYDGDMTITVEDLSQFIINWEDDNLNEELGPFVGEMPHVYVSPDGDYNYHDMGAFALMWNWYFSNNTMSFANYEDDGLPIIIETEHDSIYLDIPSELSAYQIQIKYVPGSFFIGNTDDKDGLFLSHQEQELGVYTIMAQPDQKQLVIPIEIRGRDANISISYKGIAGQGELAGQMTKSMTIENVPDEFVLYSNYPNPFNPTTKIDYGLPSKTNVSLVIYDILGREVITLFNGPQEPGYKSMTWNGTDALGRNVGAGMYFYLLQAGNNRQIKKMILLK